MRTCVLTLIATLFIGVLLPSSSRSQSPAPSSPVPAAKSELRLGYATWIGYGPLFLAREKRYFDEAGVSVALTKFEDPKSRFYALVTNRLDGLVTTVDTMSLYWTQSHQFKAVLGLADSKGVDGIIAKDSIETVKDLRGMKVAFNRGSVSHFFLSVLLRENGMTEKDIHDVQMQQDEAGRALLNHQVDAAVTWEPWLTRAKMAPGSHVLVDSSSTPGLIMDVLLLNREIIESHPNLIRSVIKGWYRAVEYWKENPDESDALMVKALGGWDVKTFQKALEGIRFYDHAINEQYFGPGGQIYVTAQKALEIWSALGMLRSTNAATDLIDSDFVLGP